MFIFRLLLCSLLALPGLAQTTTTESINVNGVTRSYILYVPASYVPGTPAPLLFNFHGYTSSASVQLAYGDFRPIADVEGFLLAVPQGLPLPGTGQPHWNVGGWTTASQSDDLGFTDAMIAEISTNYTVDDRRIYSTGFSNGGFFSFELACQRSHVIAAIGSVAGTVTPEQETAGCTPARAVPVVQIHGTSDSTIPYANSSGYSEPVSDAVGLWRGYNGASVAVASTTINTDPNDGFTVDHFRYETPGGASLVEHYRVNGGAHVWPGNPYGQAGTTQDINAARVVWDFVSQFSLPAALPVALSAFRARSLADAVRLDWTSTLEVNAAQYHIERRAAGAWTVVGRVAAQNRPATYRWTDEQPLFGISYYRLRAVDRDGSVHYSMVESVRRNDSATLNIYPNPARHSVTISGNYPEPQAYRLYNTLGARVASGVLMNNKTVLPIAHLPSGNYVLWVKTEQRRLVVE